VAYVVPHDSEHADPEQLRQLLRGRLAPYKVPKRIHFLERI
jgi:acyl-CoA synthetase (AMP-forming)/AMP-acid ligase II